MQSAFTHFELTAPVGDSDPAFPDQENEASQLVPCPAPAEWVFPTVVSSSTEPSTKPLAESTREGKGGHSLCCCHPGPPFSEAQRQEIMLTGSLWPACDSGSADVGAVVPPPMPGPAGKGRGTPSCARPSSPPAPATELIGPPQCLWPPAAVCPGATVHLVRQAQQGGCRVSGAGVGLGMGGGPWGLGRAC